MQEQHPTHLNTQTDTEEKIQTIAFLPMQPNMYYMITLNKPSKNFQALLPTSLFHLSQRHGIFKKKF